MASRQIVRDDDGEPVADPVVGHLTIGRPRGLLAADDDFTGGGAMRVWRGQD